MTLCTVADLGEGPRGPAPPPLFWVKKEEMTEGRKASRASKTPPPPPLAQGLDPPLVYELAMALLGSLMASVLQVNNAQ